MNGEDKNNTLGNVSRNTFYNMEVPEWRCENCGRFNQRDARFCRSCGSPGPMPAIAGNDLYVAEMPKKRGTAGKWAVIIAAIVLVVAALTMAVIKFVLPEDSQSESLAAGNNTESADTSNKNSDVATDDQATGDNQESAQAQYYSVGGTYYIQAKEGLKVREGPGKSYSQIYREYLSPDEYAQSLSGEYACLKQGSAVVCQEMSEDRNWMRVTSGWICVWDGTETLVR